MRPFLPFLSFLIIFTNNHLTAISALDSSCPFRTGNIYVVNQQKYYFLGDIFVNFQIDFSNPPPGIVLSPRVLETNNQTLCVDYSLSSKDISQIGFTLVVKLSQTYQMLYSRVIVNYLTVASDLNGLMVISSFQDQSINFHIHQNRLVRWEINVEQVVNQSTTSCLLEAFVSKLCMCGVGGNLTVVQDSSVYLNGSKKIRLYYRVQADLLYEIDISGIAYDSLWTNPQYDFKFNTFNLKTQYQTYMFNDVISYPTLFVGLKSIKTVVLTNIIGFGFGFESDSTENNYLSYKQSYPNEFINLTQQSQDFFEYVGSLISFNLFVCPPEFKYNYILTSQCMAKCPIGKYSDANNLCLSCFFSTKKGVEEECYRNGCAAGYYFEIIQYFPKCTDCQIVIPNCLKCFTDTNGGPYCQICQEQYFLNSSDKKCYLCESVIQNCSVCSQDAEDCTKWIIESQNQPNQDEAEQGNQNTPTKPEQEVEYQCSNTSYFNQSRNQCQQCSYQIKNCNECSQSTGQDHLTCNKCNVNLTAYSSQTVDSLNYTYSTYVDYHSSQCRTCSAFCTQCVDSSTCLSCYNSSTLSTRLENNYCIECNSNSSDFLSVLPLCCLSTQTICMFSKYNAKKQTCEYSEDVRQALGIFATITSINVVHTVFRQLLLVVGLLEDFSYYSFHQRNYSKIVQMFFNEMRNFTLSRFKPLFLNGLYSKINIQIKQLQFKYQDSSIPKQFAQNNRSIYFLNATQDIWIGTAPMHLALIIVLSFLKWFIDRFIKKGWCECNIPGFIIIMFIETNMQYILFQCFSQLYQPIIFDTFYVLNLTLNFSVCLILVLYGVGGSFFYKSVYRQINSIQYFEKTTWVVFWTSSNILKILTAFVHSRLYYQPLIQSYILFSIFLTKAILFAYFMRSIKSNMQYIFQLMIPILFVILQSFFVVELIMKQKGEYTVYNQIYTGNLEYLIIMMMVASQVLSVLTKFLSLVLGFILKKIKNLPQSNKETQNQQMIQSTTYKINILKVNQSLGAIQAVDLEDQIAVQIPQRQSKIYDIQTAERSYLMVDGIHPTYDQNQRLSYQPTRPKPEKTVKHHSYQPNDTDFQSVIQMLTCKVRDQKSYKSKIYSLKQKQSLGRNK